MNEENSIIQDAYKGLSNEDELLVRRDYQSRQDSLAALGVAARHISESILRAREIPFHSVKYRVKSISSVLEKIARKRYGPDLDKFTDLVGVRIICLSPSHLDQVVDLVREQFSVIELVDKRPKADSQVFGYSSIHLICQVKNTPRAELTEFIVTAGATFEVQVRTILQEAWSEMDHRLVYKSQTAAPAEIQRLITRLSVALENADELFQQIFDKRKEYIGQLKATNAAELLDEKLNIDSLTEVMRRTYPWTEGWQEGRGDEHSSQDLNLLLRELNSLGLVSAGELTTILEKWKDAVFKESKKAYQKALEPVPSSPDFEGTIQRYSRPTSDWQVRAEHFYTPIGLVRRTLSHEFPKYRAPRRQASSDPEE